LNESEQEGQRNKKQNQPSLDWKCGREEPDEEYVEDQDADRHCSLRLLVKKTITKKKMTATTRVQVSYRNCDSD
jgi:hypothetical protein